MRITQNGGQLAGMFNRPYLVSKFRLKDQVGPRVGPHLCSKQGLGLLSNFNCGLS